MRAGEGQRRHARHFLVMMGTYLNARLRQTNLRRETFSGKDVGIMRSFKLCKQFRTQSHFHLPFSRASICSCLNEVLFRCSFRLSRILAAASSSGSVGGFWSSSGTSVMFISSWASMIERAMAAHKSSSAALEHGHSGSCHR